MTTGPTIQILDRATFVAGQIRFALFDFDGTLSLLRAGWQEVMEQYFTAVLVEADPASTPQTHAVACRDFITQLTGRQTIFQAMELARRVEAAGQAPLSADAYKAEYLRRLHAKIAHRLHGLRQGEHATSQYLVPGSLHLLQALQAAGVVCYLASGTDLPNVLEEAELLGVSQFFTDADGCRIYGALPEYQDFSKRMIIEQIISEHGLVGPELVTFGDGYVEIEETRRAGGMTVAIASRDNGDTGLDEWKAERLQEVCAHVLVADWMATDELLDTLGFSRA